MKYSLSLTKQESKLGALAIKNDSGYMDINHEPKNYLSYTWTSYHLHAVSHEEDIEIGDIVDTPLGVGRYKGKKDIIHYTELFETCNKINIYHCMDGLFITNHKKVMATTNSLLGLPLIEGIFILDYIERYNNKQRLYCIENLKDIIHEI